MNTPPRLTIGLPVYNGGRYLAQSIEALLGQTFGDFELVISDNASTDCTADICARYMKLDDRIRYFRQPRNIGLSPNHNFVVAQAKGELFKWASHDDLYARDLIGSCIDALDAHPDVILAHSWSAVIDGSGAITKATKYELSTASPRAPERFRSLLFDDGGDDDGGVIWTNVLRRVSAKDSYHHADRTFVAELSLHGRFYQVPDWLYFRRDHPERAERAFPTVRDRAANLDPRRADRLRHPTVRLYAEYVLGYVRAIRRAPIGLAERQECYRHLAHWVTRLALWGQAKPAGGQTPPVCVQGPRSVETVVAGRERLSS